MNFRNIEGIAIVLPDFKVEIWGGEWIGGSGWETVGRGPGATGHLTHRTLTLHFSQIFCKVVAANSAVVAPPP